MSQYSSILQKSRKKIEIFKIQDGGGRHLENRFLAITHQRFSDFGEILCEEAEWPF